MREAQASLALNQAAVRTAELNLSYAEIHAPFAGRLGRNQASVGTLVSVAGTVLNTLVQLDPIYVTFNPSETDLAEIEQARAAGPIDVEVLVPGETEASQKGELTFIDNTVDRFDRHDHGARNDRQWRSSRCCRASMSASVCMSAAARCADGAADGAGLEPARQISSTSSARATRSTSGWSRSARPAVTMVAVLSGVSEGDQVITGNLQKIGPGAPVSPMPQKPAT